MRIGNTFVRWILRSPFHRLLSRSVMLLTYRGRRSGREYTIPVGYARHDDDVLVLVGRSSVKTWWRNFHEPAPVRMRIAGEVHVGTARVADIFETRPLRSAYLEASPKAARSFGIALADDGSPDPAAVALADIPVIVIEP